MSIEEIESAIKTLPKDQLARFNQWYEAFFEEQWDEQIGQGVRSGKLDFLLEETKRERKAGELRPFPLIPPARPGFGGILMHSPTCKAGKRPGSGSDTIPSMIA